MRLMTFTEFTDYLTSIYNYSVYCAAKPQGWIGCNLFWGWAYLIALTALFLFCCRQALFIYNQRKEWRVFLAKKAEREKIADPETMSKHVWTGDF